MQCPDYRESSAGVRSLHRLCHVLNEAGHVSFVTGKPNPAWHEHQAERRFAKQADVAVYPEGVHDDLGVRNVVRWVLGQTPPHIRFPKGQRVLYPLTWFRASAERCAQRELPAFESRLYVSTVDPNIFFPGPLREFRRKACVHFGKSEQKIDRRFLDASGFTILGGGYTPTEFGALLRNTHTLYLFDHQTQLALEAAACGVSVMLVETWEMNSATGRLKLTGHAWGPQDFFYYPEKGAALFDRIAFEWANPIGLHHVTEGWE